MTDKEKIREFLVGMADADCCVTQVAKAINKTILPYIDSLQEEPVSEDMEAEFFRAVHNLREQPTLSAWFRHFYNLVKHGDNGGSVATADGEISNFLANHIDALQIIRNGNAYSPNILGHFTETAAWHK